MSVPIYSGRWLPGPSSFRVLSRPMLGEAASVSVLKLPLGEWNVQLVSESFLPADQQAILSTPSSTSRLLDVLCWHYDPLGDFSVKSGYHLGKSLKAVAGPSSGSSTTLW
ncbi:hypothetical protein ACOSQ4_024301 [Xanthoceras sorbifolium]